MPDLHWLPGPYGDHDLVDDAGNLRGYVSRLSEGFRAYTIARANSRSATFSDLRDFSDEQEAIAWAEAMSRRALAQQDKGKGNA